ncbi:MAG: oligosaccharide flippase family protein [Candidatus Omnitrophota bacterium]
MQRKNKILRDITQFSGATFISTLILMLRELIIARFLSPSFYGTWHLFKVMIDHGRHISLGMGWTMQKDIPEYLGQGRKDKSEEAKDITISSILILSTTACILFIFAGKAFLTLSDFSITMGHIILFSCFLYIQQINNFLLMLLSAYQRFSFKSKVIVLQALLSVIFIFIFIGRLKVTGIILALFCSYFLTSGASILKMRYRFRFTLNIKEAFKMIKEGITILTNGFLLNLMEAADRILVGLLLSSTQLGYYGLAFASAKFIGLIPTAIGEALFPSLAEKYGQKQDIEHIRNYVVKPRLAFAYIAPFIIGAAYFSVDLIILYFLPQYVPGIKAVKITLLFSFFAVLPLGLVYFFFTLGDIRKVLGLRLVSILLEVALVFIFVKYGFGIEGAAVGRGLSYLFFSLVLLYLAYRYYVKKTKQILIYLFETVFPCVYTLLFLLAFDFAIRISGQNILSDLFKLAIKSLLLAMVSFPLWVYLNKQINILDEIKALLVKSKIGLDSEEEINE